MRALFFWLTQRTRNVSAQVRGPNQGLITNEVGSAQKKKKKKKKTSEEKISEKDQHTTAVWEDSLVPYISVEAIIFQRVCKNRMRIWKQFFFLPLVLNLARDRIAKEKKKAICVWLLSLASLEPGWAWASKCQSDKDQAWQTDTGVLSFRVSSLLRASPIFAGLKSPEMMVGGGNILRANVRLCNSAKCHNSSNRWGRARTVLLAFESFHYCLVCSAAGSPWKHKTHQLPLHKRTWGYPTRGRGGLSGVRGFWMGSGI